MEWGRARLNRRRFGMLQEVGQARPPQIFIAFTTELQFLSITFIRKLCALITFFTNSFVSITVFQLRLKCHITN